MDFTKEKKILADQWSIAFQGLFNIGFTSGLENFAFSIPPAGAKTLSEQLSKLIEQYEKDNGSIDTSSTPVSQLSPMQKGK